jgi:2-amino-4-hydroxy-6-hydroxymethyldihydropteridine diphosphokinase
MLAYLGLGSNLGNRFQQLQDAVTALSNEQEVCECSSVYESQPWGYNSQPDFLNAVIALRTDLGPMQLLAECRRIEAELGRRKRPRWQEREIDIDILLVDDLVLMDPQLTVPHPSMLERDFVLVPLLEVAPQLIHPQNGKPLVEFISSKPGLTRYQGGALVC